ncbi:MAG: poly-gamma-glutamate hydrolase family protein [Elusimicrobiota bacterium]|jgi:phage replication-related protein YjqB (UPF0714/DUF867 family)
MMLRLAAAFCSTLLWAAPLPQKNAPCTPECGSWQELRENFKENKDFRILVQDRQAAVTVFAPHGGDIEPGTSRLARTLAGNDWNLYLLEGLIPKNRRMHVTSAKFDEPDALSLARKTEWGLSVHGSKDAGLGVCIGGANAPLREKTAAALRKAGFETEEPCRRLPGRSSSNLVNRARQAGVQLELPRELFSRLEDPKQREQFRSAVRSAFPK